MAVRSSWEGYLKLSLVSVPVKAYTACSSAVSPVSLNQLQAECHSRIKLDNLRTESDKSINVRTFVPADANDPIYHSGRSDNLIPDSPVSQKPVWLFLLALWLACRPAAAEDMLVLQGHQAEMVWAPAGGALVRFRFLDDKTNPLSFEITPAIERPRNDEPILRGHFLCLDRWGAPSAAEAAHGMPFHGEAPRIHWVVDRTPDVGAGTVGAGMSATLPLAGLRVSRRIALDEAGTIALVTERVTNTNKMGRIYNLVQHPSIAPPFLNDGTIVDSNAREGLVQDQPVPVSRDAAGSWPHVRLETADVDLRRFRAEPSSETQHDVSSFVFADGEVYGWVTASSPAHKLLLGYVWTTADYPWLNIWRYRQEGQVAARGLEFGTTGYHQPFPVLVRQGRILDRSTFEFLDADETATRSYVCFLARIPPDFEGVRELVLDGGRIRLRERRNNDPRTIELATRLTESLKPEH